AREAGARPFGMDRAAQEDIHWAARRERQVGGSAADRASVAAVSLDAGAAAARRGDSPRERRLPADVRARMGARQPRDVRSPSPAPRADRREASARLRAFDE